MSESGDQPERDRRQPPGGLLRRWRDRVLAPVRSDFQEPDLDDWADVLSEVRSEIRDDDERDRRVRRGRAGRRRGLPERPPGR